MDGMDESSRHRQFEARFLQQLRARAQALLGRGLPADRLHVTSTPDGIDAVRATLVRLGKGRELLEKLPGTQALEFEFRRRVFGPFHRRVARLRTQVVAPLEALIKGRSPGPIGREAVLDALARYDVLPQRERPTAVALASATGFTAEARALVHRGDAPTLILLGGRPDGGWDIEMPERLRSTGWAGMFELESQDERLERLLYHLNRNASLLESRGLSTRDLADQLGLPPDEVAGLLRQACRTDPRLMTITHDGVLHVCRSPLADEDDAMSLKTWIRKLFRMKPTVAEQVRALTAQRVHLEQQRHELDQRLDELEKQERHAVESGAAAKSEAERKQIAGRLMRTRRQLRRVRAQANVFSQQIDVLGTHIHHLTLAQQGKQVSLPSAEELTQEAAEAEQIMTQLSVNADLAANIEVGAQSEAMNEEEAAILAEFQQAADERAPAAPESSTTPPATIDESAEDQPQRESGTDEQARPEMG